MTDPNNTVVPKPSPMTEDEFHGVFLQSLARMIVAHRADRVAMWLGVSVRHLGNIKKGSLPTADRIWNLLAHDATAHDEMDKKFGLRNVPDGSVCTTDPVAAKISALLTKAIEAESPNSPGGVAVTLHEILGMDEVTLRDVHQTLGGWISRIDAARESSALRSVA